MSSLKFKVNFYYLFIHIYFFQGGKVEESLEELLALEKQTRTVKHITSFYINPIIPRGVGEFTTKSVFTNGSKNPDDVYFCKILEIFDVYFSLCSNCLELSKYLGKTPY